MSDNAQPTTKRSRKKRVVLSTPSGSRLHLGMRDAANPDITVAQELLAAHGHDVGGEEGFGPATAEAVRAFQRASGTKVDGVVGLRTWKLLQASPRKRAPLPAVVEEVDSSQ